MLYKQQQTNTGINDEMKHELREKTAKEVDKGKCIYKRKTNEILAMYQAQISHLIPSSDTKLIFWSLCDFSPQGSNREDTVDTQWDKMTNRSMHYYMLWKYGPLRALMDGCSLLGHISLGDIKW